MCEPETSNSDSDGPVRTIEEMRFSLVNGKYVPQGLTPAHLRQKTVVDPKMTFTEEADFKETSTEKLICHTYKSRLVCPGDRAPDSPACHNPVSSPSTKKESQDRIKLVVQELVQGEVLDG